MGLLAARSYRRVWDPDADSVNGPADSLLRGDNLMLDERGVVSLRPGSAKINGVAFADTDIHSLYTAVLNGTRYRMAGASNAVYANGVSIASGLAGSDDISFGTYQGQILFARSTSKKKYDGTVRNWGISMTGGTPTAVALAPDEKTFATCNTGEAPGFTAIEGTINATYPTGQDGTANGAIESDPASTTGRGSIQKVFAAETDYTVYDAGETGTENDLLQLYVYVTDPSSLLDLTIMVDVNGSSTNRFQDDYYTFTLKNGETIPITAAEGGRQRPAGTPISGFAVRRVDATLSHGGPSVPAPPPSTRLRPDAPVANAGWNRVQIRRGDFERIGSTSGKDWRTVRAIRLVVSTFGGGTAEAVRFDNIKFVGGNLRPLTGTFQWVYVLVRNDGTYTAKSAPSTASAQTVLQVSGATITVPADGSRDSQVNEAWLFRMGGTLDAFYRVTVKTGVSGTGSFTIDDTLSAEDALILNVPLEIDNTVPPNNIIGIDGPYFDRVFALTATDLYPSRRRNPDSFATGQVIHIAGADEVCYWVKKSFSSLFIGTSKDIYRLEGDGAELPDDSINFTLTPLSIDHPPISAAIAQDGHTLIYLANDGWRVLAGAGSVTLSETTTLLWKGYTRHGVSPPNLTAGRFRAAIGKGQLAAITPVTGESTNATSIWRYVFPTHDWYNWVYAAGGVYATHWRSILREPDGTLIAGDTGGFVWTLDTGTQDDGNNLAVNLWTRVEDAGLPLQRKDPQDLHIKADTGNVATSVALHLDGSASASTTKTVTANGMTMSSFDLSALASFRQVQLRVTVSTAAFKWYDYGLGFLDLPIPMIGRVADSNAGDMAEKVLAGLEIKFCGLAAAKLFTPYLDNVALSQTFTITTDASTPETHLLQFTSLQTATDIGFAVDGDIELIEWQPIILYRLPTRVKVWENKPLVRSLTRRRFGGLVVQVHTHGGVVTITPVVDGTDQATQTVTSSDLVASVVTRNAVVGHDLWCRMSGATAFSVLSVDPIIVETLPQFFKGTTPRTHLGYQGVKTASGYQLRVCTLGVARTFTPVVDGVAQTTFSVTSAAGDPVDYTHAFSAAIEGVEWSLTVDGDVELYAWAPIVTAKRPLGVKAWDSGPIDLGTQDLVWLREVRLKVRAGADLTITPWFDSVVFPAVTATVTANADTVVVVPVGRAYVGRQPRLVITSSAPFYPYWLDFTRRTTGKTSEKPSIRVPATLEVSA